MQPYLLVLIIGLFFTLLVVNVYVRLKVIKHYKYLVNNKVVFDQQHILDTRRLKHEILPKYPQHKTQIEAFVNHIRTSVKIAAILVSLIVITAIVLYINR